MEEKNFQAVLEALKSYMKARSKSEIARNLGVTPQSLATYEKQGKFPYGLLVRYCLKQEISVDWLLAGRVVKSTAWTVHSREGTSTPGTAKHCHSLMAIIESDGSLRFIVEELSQDPRLKEVLHTLIRGMKQGARTTRLLISSAGPSEDLIAEFEEWPGPTPGGEGGDDAKKR